MKGSKTTSSALDRLLESLSRCFDLSTARALSELRQDEVARKRMEKLGKKAGAGTLTATEKREYEALVEVSDVIATLQLKARQQLTVAKSG